MFEEIEAKRLNQVAKKLKFLPYVFVGILVFTFNANYEMNPYLQVYITLLETQLGIVVLYFLTKKLGK